MTPTKMKGFWVRQKRLALRMTTSGAKSVVRSSDEQKSGFYTCRTQVSGFRRILRGSERFARQICHAR